MFENFYRSGKYESPKIALNWWVRNRKDYFGRHIATSAVIRLETVVFVREYVCVVDLISIGVKHFSGI